MTDSKIINGHRLSLIKGDITDMDVEAFVFYATEDLKLGSGYGGAIRVRGGPTIQKALDELAPIKLTGAVITDAGTMKAKYIVHSVGPKFQEPDTEKKLHKTMVNALDAAKAKGIKQIAFPPMGVGFYCIPREVSAKITMDIAREHLQGDTSIEEIIFCCLDSWLYGPFEAQLSSITAG